MSFEPLDLSTSHPLCMDAEPQPRMPPNNLAMVNNPTHLSEPLENSDTRCWEFEEFYNWDDSAKDQDFVESFLQGDLALARIAELERLLQRDLLVGNNKLDESAFVKADFPRCGIGESPLADLCFEVGTKRKHGPTKLIQRSIDGLGEDRRVLANNTKCSKITNAIAMDTFDLNDLKNGISSNDNTAQIVDYFRSDKSNVGKRLALKSAKAFPNDDCKENAKDRLQQGDSYRTMESPKLKYLPTVHMGKATGEKLFECVICGQKYCRKGNLVNHIKFHACEESFEPFAYGRKVAKKRHLAAHLKSHIGEKPYECLTCGHKCSRKGNLVNHIKIHAREKSSGCVACACKAARKRSLTAQFKTQTGEKPLESRTCETCATEPCLIERDDLNPSIVVTRL